MEDKHTIIDLESLLPKIWSSNSKALLSEAIAAYKAGAYRASVISTWLAILVDLFDKASEIAVIEEKGKAKEIRDILDKILSQPEKKKAIQAMRKLEDEILLNAKDDLQLISEIEYIHLERIREDRNLCAHPSISGITLEPYNPEAELCRLYIIEACSFLLMYPPTLGTKHAEEIVNKVKLESFPTDKKKATAILNAPSALRLIKRSAFRSILDLLIKKLLIDIDGDTTEIHRQKYTVAIYACSKIHPDDFDEMFPILFSKALQRTTLDPPWGAELLGILEHQYEIDAGDLQRISSQIDRIPFDFTNKWESSGYNTLLIESTPNITKASKYRGIEEALIKVLGSVGEKQIELKTTLFRIWEPQEFLVETYIQYFANASCYAYADIATPTLDRYAKLFTENDLETLLLLIEKNGEKYGGKHMKNNQILESGNAETIYTTLYRRCQYSDIWKNYLNTTIGLEEAHRRNYLKNILKSESLYSQNQDPYSKLGV